MKGDILMRRADREVTELSELLRIMEQCDVCRLALHNGAYPYILPLNFGLAVQDDTVKLYFHGATEGTKLELMQKDDRASFEMDCAHELITDPERGYCTMEYQSVIGQGRLAILPDDEKLEALRCLMKQYHKETFPFSTAALPRTTVFQLTVEHMTGKIKQKQH